MTKISRITFGYENNDNIILTNLGLQLKQMRLNKNITQHELCKRVGISRSVISDIENGGNGTLNSFVRILRALEKLEILNNFIEDAPVSPIQISKLKGKTRQRASGKKLKNNNEDSEW